MYSSSICPKGALLRGHKILEILNEVKERFCIPNIVIRELVNRSMLPSPLVLLGTGIKKGTFHNYITYAASGVVARPKEESYTPVSPPHPLSCRAYAFDCSTSSMLFCCSKASVISLTRTSGTSSFPSTSIQRRM